MTKLYLTMPQPGETITEGTIVKWIVKPGDAVQEGTPVAELETDKAVFEYECPFEGQILEIIQPDAARVKVAEPIAMMEVEEGKARMYLSLGIAKAVGAPTEAATPIAAAPTEAAPVSIKPAASGVRLSPFVKKLVAKHGISEAVLAQLAQQSPEGRITKEAVQDYIAKGGPVSASQASEGNDDYTATPCSAIRMRIAENMVKSKTTIPHAHTGITVDVTSVVDYRNQNKETFKKQNGANLNLLSLMYPALVKAVQAAPVVNASYDDSCNPHQIKVFKKINLGVAVGSEQGLLITCLRDIGNQSFKGFNTDLNSKIQKAQTKKLMPDDLTGSTLIFNNFGFFGTSFGGQIIQYPLAATLGMGAIEERVVPVNGEIKIRKMCDFMLAFDHRVMDGRETGAFLTRFKKEIEAMTDLGPVDAL